MNLSDIIKNAVKSVGDAWHTSVQPWLSNFLGNVLHAEVEQIVPIAEEFVTAAVPALVAAIKSGDTEAFADAQWDALKATADKIKDTGLKVALTAASTAVTALIAGHPDIVAATAGQTSSP